MRPARTTRYRSAERRRRVTKRSASAMMTPAVGRGQADQNQPEEPHEADERERWKLPISESTTAAAKPVNVIYGFGGLEGFRWLRNTPCKW